MREKIKTKKLEGGGLGCKGAPRMQTRFLGGKYAFSRMEMRFLGWKCAFQDGNALFRMETRFFKDGNTLLTS
jgi:hypothetical protein